MDCLAKRAVYLAAFFLIFSIVMLLWGRADMEIDAKKRKKINFFSFCLSMLGLIFLITA